MLASAPSVACAFAVTTLSDDRPLWACSVLLVIVEEMVDQPVVAFSKVPWEPLEHRLTVRVLVVASHALSTKSLLMAMPPCVTSPHCQSLRKFDPVFQPP